MTQLEMVEKLREMANISFEEAKNTLERNNWDMLDAAIELEKTGRTVKTSNSYTTGGEFKNNEGNLVPCGRHEDSGFKKLWSWIISLLKKSIVNKFEIQHDGETILIIPVLLLILLLFIAPYTVIIVLVIGLLFRLRYSFRGEDLGKKEVNDVFDRAADYADNLKDYVNDQADSKRKEQNSNGDKDSDN
jgi:hypothetical protein